MMGLRLLKQGSYATTRETLVSFSSGLSKTSFKLFSETIFSWVSTTFCGYSNFSNIEMSKVFWYVPCCKFTLRCEIGEQNQSGETDANQWVQNINLFQVCCQQY